MALSAGISEAYSGNLALTGLCQWFQSPKKVASWGEKSRQKACKIQKYSLILSIVRLYKEMPIPADILAVERPKNTVVIAYGKDKNLYAAHPEGP